MKIYELNETLSSLDVDEGVTDALRRGVAGVTNTVDKGTQLAKNAWSATKGAGSAIRHPFQSAAAASTIHGGANDNLTLAQKRQMRQTQMKAKQFAKTAMQSWNAFNAQYAASLPPNKQQAYLTHADPAYKKNLIAFVEKNLFKGMNMNRIVNKDQVYKMINTMSKPVSPNNLPPENKKQQQNKTTGEAQTISNTNIPVNPNAPMPTGTNSPSSTNPQASDAFKGTGTQSIPNNPDMEPTRKTVPVGQKPTAKPRSNSIRRKNWLEESVSTDLDMWTQLVMAAMSATHDPITGYNAINPNQSSQQRNTQTGNKQQQGKMSDIAIALSEKGVDPHSLQKLGLALKDVMHYNGVPLTTTGNVAVDEFIKSLGITIG